MKQEHIYKQFVFEPNLPRPSECEQDEIESSSVDLLDLASCSVCENNYEPADISDEDNRICYGCSN